MKMIIAAVAVLLTAFAANAHENHTQISKYRGASYGENQLAQCEADYRQVVSGLESLKGFKVIEGGCVTGTFYKGHYIGFTYSHPVVSRIDNFRKDMANKEQCLSMADSAKEQMSSAGDFFVASYCQGKELNVDFVDQTRTVIRSLFENFHFSTASQCDGFIKDLSQKLASENISVLFGACNAIKSFDGKISYKPSLNFHAHFTKKVELIKGKTLSEGQACFENISQVQRDFQDNELNLAHTFCVDSNESSYEVLVYVQKDGGKRIKTFKGGVYGQSECSYQLDSAEANLASLGHPSVYKFCKDLGSERFMPVIHYVH